MVGAEGGVVVEVEEVWRWWSGAVGTRIRREQKKVNHHDSTSQSIQLALQITSTTPQSRLDDIYRPSNSTHPFSKHVSDESCRLIASDNFLYTKPLNLIRDSTISTISTQSWRASQEASSSFRHPHPSRDHQYAPNASATSKERPPGDHSPSPATSRSNNQRPQNRYPPPSKPLDPRNLNPPGPP